MNSLDDAWRWYEATHSRLNLMGRLARRYWAALPWEGLLARDSRLSDVAGSDVVEDVQFSLAHLDDLAVLVIFAVFEAIVRSRVLIGVRREGQALRHVALRSAVEEAIARIEEGSFFRVLEPFKLFDSDLVEQVNQVRRYRNWVAHGRRGEAPTMVTPKAAFDRLSRFLSLLDEPSPPEVV